MPFDDANWNGDSGDDPRRQVSWSYVLTASAISGLTVVRMEHEFGYVVLFVLGDDLPAGTTIWACACPAVSIAFVTYPVQTGGSSVTVRVEAVPLQ